MLSQTREYGCRRGWANLIFHRKPCRDFQGLQDLTESPVCQEIQDRRDPQAILPTLGWVEPLYNKYKSNHSSSTVWTLSKHFSQIISGQLRVTDDFRFQWEIQSVWDGVRNEGERRNKKCSQLHILSLFMMHNSVWLSLFQGESGPRGLPGSPGSQVSKDSILQVTWSADLISWLSLLFRARPVVREYQERLEIQDWWWETFCSSFYILDSKPVMLRLKLNWKSWRFLVVLRASRVIGDQMDRLEKLELMWVKHTCTYLQKWGVFLLLCASTPPHFNTSLHLWPKMMLQTSDLILLSHFIHFTPFCVIIYQ